MLLVVVVAGFLLTSCASLSVKITARLVVRSKIPRSKNYVQYKVFCVSLASIFASYSLVVVKLVAQALLCVYGGPGPNIL